MIIKGYNKFKQVFNDLFKKYHPDNTITGDAEKFIKYKNIYDDLLNSNTIEKIQNNIEIDITTTKAYNGCEIKYDNYTLKIPKNFYNDKKSIDIVDKNNNIIKFFINIIPEKDERIYFSNGNLIVIKEVHINIFDIILGKNIVLDIFGEKYDLKLKPYEVLTKSSITIPNKGYPKRNNNKRNDLTVKFLFDMIPLSEKDIDVIKGLKKNYEK